MTIKCEKTCLVKKNIFQSLYTIKSYISAHQSSLWRYSLVYDHMPNYTLGTFLQGVYFYLLHGKTCDKTSESN